MNRVKPGPGLIFLTAILTAAWIGADAVAPSQGKPNKLKGARDVIEAKEYTSLQKALDAVPEAGGMVRLPPGRFEIRQPLRVHSQDVLIEGAGTATWIVNVATGGQPALVLEPRENSGDGAYNWRVTLRGFRITGNAKSGTGILARRINEILIDGVHVSRHGGDGIQLDHCYEDPRVCDSLITYNAGTGLNLVGCHDIVVSANQFEENQDAVRCTDGFNLCMTGNNIDDHLGNGIVIENTYGSVVAGNMIEECRGRGVVIDRDCYGIALSANVIAHNERGGVDLRDAWGMTVSANAFTIMGKDALSIGPDSGRIAVTGNSFADSYVGDAKIKRRADDRAAGGVVLRGASEVNFTGNLFAGLKPTGFRVAKDSQRIVFRSNLLIDASRVGEVAATTADGNLELRK